MSLLHALILGITQGLTEFFPISSSGHLGLVPWLFGWDDFGGDEDLQKAFDVALHMGTLLGALTYFRKDVARYAREGLGPLVRPRAEGEAREWSTDGRIAWLLVLSAVPAAITGVLLNDLITELDDDIWLIGVMLIVFGLVLWWADRLPGTRRLEEFSLRDSLSMGIGQALALQPGVSRSGVTISVGRYRAFSRDAAARLSFLMSLPVIAGAGLYTAADVAGAGGIPADLRGAFVVGFLASAVSGWFAVWGTITLVRTHSFTPFVIYRIALGVLVLGLLATGVR